MLLGFFLDLSMAQRILLSSAMMLASILIIFILMRAGVTPIK